jgi:hypothetical protein
VGARASEGGTAPPCLVSSVLQAAVMMIAPNNGRQKIRKFFMSLDHGGLGGGRLGAHTPKLMKIQCPTASGQSAKVASRTIRTAAWLKSSRLFFLGSSKVRLLCGWSFGPLPSSRLQGWPGAASQTGHRTLGFLFAMPTVYGVPAQGQPLWKFKLHHYQRLMTSMSFACGAPLIPSITEG